MPFRYSPGLTAVLALLVCLMNAANAAQICSDEAEVPDLHGQSCMPHEALIFAGEVRDDFGLDITVCIAETDHAAGAEVIVRYSGEGGNREVSCRSKQCDEKIEFSHYVRAKFTVLALTWRDENGEQKLVESFDAQDKFADPVHTVNHIWAPRLKAGSLGDPESYPVAANTPPLSLLTLENWL